MNIKQKADELVEVFENAEVAILHQERLIEVLEQSYAYSGYDIAIKTQIRDQRIILTELKSRL